MGSDYGQIEQVIVRCPELLQLGLAFLFGTTVVLAVAVWRVLSR